MSETFPIKYRPEYLDQMMGNKVTIEKIKKILKKDRSKQPSAWLFVGPAGCGKTTLARIVKDELGCDPFSFNEYNASNTRGIDTIRAIQEDAGLAPRAGDIKVYLLDECFHPDTLIDTPNGKVKIKDIQIGDSVFNLYGTDTVIGTKINKVPLNRLCLITLSNNQEIFTTVEHKFLTNTGWEKAQNLKGALCVSNRISEINTELFRVKNVILYNEENLINKITNEERHKGFVEFHDLQIKNHPSYKAGGVIVHNCHLLTREAQNAILKLLEDTPKHTVFMLATTNPEKLIKPIHSRCTMCKVSSLPNKLLIELINEILIEELGEEEANQFPADVLEAIARNSNGACRDALKLLDNIIDMDDFDDMIEACEQGYSDEGTIKELCTMLKTPRTTWAQMSKFLKNFDVTNPESIRLVILAWFSKMLLDDGSIRTAQILEAFESNYYDNGKAGLYLSCFSVVTNLK